MQMLSHCLWLQRRCSLCTTQRHYECILVSQDKNAVSVSTTFFLTLHNHPSLKHWGRETVLFLAWETFNLETKRRKGREIVIKRRFLHRLLRFMRRHHHHRETAASSTGSIEYMNECTQTFWLWDDVLCNCHIQSFWESTQVCLICSSQASSPSLYLKALLKAQRNHSLKSIITGIITLFRGVNSKETSSSPDAKLNGVSYSRGMFRDYESHHMHCRCITRDASSSLKTCPLFLHDIIKEKGKLFLLGSD